MKLSACVGVFDSTIPIETIANILNSSGYTGIELLGEPKKYSDIAKLKKTLNKFSLNVTALTACSRLKTGRDLAASDTSVRQSTIDHYSDCIKMASELSCPLVGITLTPVGRFIVEDDLPSERKRAADSVSQLLKIAKTYNVTLIIEVLNRYASFMMNTLADCQNFIVDNGFEGVGICADLFHMNIEEGDLAASIISSKGYLKNIHIADSNRHGIGTGHIDFWTVYKSLLDSDFPGPITLEAWATSNNPFSNQNSSTDEITGYLKSFSRLLDQLNLRYQDSYGKQN